ncbi:MAG: lysophospholipid acyltransferase family protein [Desulfatibacillaceae bacterium]|nr:lysophospholipid acyltransferase family protein [Desulfatibacillaceae bacterium]
MPFLGANTLFFATAAIASSFVVPGEKAGRFLGRQWSRVNAKATPFSVEVIGRENIEPGRSYIVCSNHQSHFDIFVIYGWLGLDIRWVMKMELRKIPVFGKACERIGHIYIDRSDSHKAVKSLEEAKGRIKDGACVVFFPEGTRSRDGKLQRFKKGAFRMALDLGLPILPLTITGTRDILPARSMDLFPGKACLKIHKPVETESYKDKGVNKLMDAVHLVIASGLDKD